MPGDGPAGMQMPSAPAHDLAGFRLVTLCGSAGGMHDAMRDSQDLLEPVFVSRGIDVRPVDLGDWSAAGVPKLVAEIKRQQPDGILMQYPTGAFGRSLGPILLSLVHHVAPTMVMLHEFAAAQLPRKAAVGALLLRADRIGYTAERERKHVTAAFPWLRNRMREVPIASNIPSRVWAPTDPVTITYFGQLRPNKGIEEFVEVRRRIAAELPEARFEIIGAVVPQHADYAEALQRTSLEADISIAANLGVNEVADGLARSNVALMPFPDGGQLPLGSLFAAASCGAPIATTIGVDTPPELLPFLEPAQTIDELTAVTLKLLRDPAAREAAHQNSMIFSAKFGWEQTADSYCKVFRELKQLGRGNPRSTDATRALFQMSFTATGPVLLLLALYIFAFKPRQLIYFAVFFAPFSATAVINFNSVGYKAGGVGITAATTFTLFFFASQFIYGRLTERTRVSPGHLMQLGLLVLFLTIAYLALIYNAALGTLFNPVTTHTVYITLAIIATILFSLEFTHDGAVEKTIKIMRAAATFVSLWGLMQLICSFTGIPYPSAVFNNSNSDAADMFAQSFGDFARIASVTVEPSVMAATLLHFCAIGVTLIVRDARFRTRAWIIPVVIVVGTLLLSTSSTGYIGLCVVALLMLVERPVFTAVAGVPVLTVLFAILATLPKARDILLASTIYKSESFSYSDRKSEIAVDFADFLHHPVLGSGWGRAVNFNGAVSLLCNVGVVGTTIFLACGLLTLVSLVLGARQARAEDWKMATFAVGVRNALIVASVCAVTSGMKYVFLNDWVIWGLGIAIGSRLEITQRATRHVASWAPRVRNRVAL